MDSPRRREKNGILFLDLGVHKSKLWIHQVNYETLKAWNRKWKWIVIPNLVPITKS